jgi:hypothetical protein
MEGGDDMTENWLREVMERASIEIKKWPEEFREEARRYYSEAESNSHQCGTGAEYPTNSSG